MRVRDLTKHFAITRGIVFQKSIGAVHAVDGVSLEIERGETLGIVGETGCGKSTTARLIMRLLDASAGEITFDGRDITRAKGAALKAIRREMQMIFQDPYSSLNPRKTVGSIIAEPFAIHRLMSDKGERKREVQRLMETVGLNPEHYNRYPHEFSGGQRQRITPAALLATLVIAVPNTFAVPATASHTLAAWLAWRCRSRSIRSPPATCRCTSISTGQRTPPRAGGHPDQRDVLERSARARHRLRVHAGPRLRRHPAAHRHLGAPRVDPRQRWPSARRLVRRADQRHRRQRRGAGDSLASRDGLGFQAGEPRRSGGDRAGAGCDDRARPAFGGRRRTGHRRGLGDACGGPAARRGFHTLNVDEQATAIAVSLPHETVVGHCGLGCDTLNLPATASTLVVRAVIGGAAYTARLPVAFDAGGDGRASALLRRLDAGQVRLHSALADETLASTPAVVETTDYDIQAPNGFAYQVAQQYGGRRRGLTHRIAGCCPVPAGRAGP